MHVHKSIVYVEDEPEIRRTYERAMEKAGYRVYSATTAQEAIDILDTYDDIRCLVVDLFLPEHNGLAILHHIQSYADWQSIPVIILSAKNRDEIQASDEYLADLGVVNYCDKTQTEPKDLIRTLSEVIGGNQT